METHTSTDKVYEGESLPHRTWARPAEELGPLSFEVKFVDALLSLDGTQGCRNCYDNYSTSPKCCWTSATKKSGQEISSLKEELDKTIQEHGDNYQRECMDAFNTSLDLAHFVAPSVANFVPPSFVDGIGGSDNSCGAGCFDRMRPLCKAGKCVMPTCKGLCKHMDALMHTSLVLVRCSGTL